MNTMAKHSVMSEYGVISCYTRPAIQLENGLNVYVVENNELPIVSAFMLYNVGIVDEPAELQGITDLTVNMLSEGTEKRDGKSFIEDLESTGAYINSKTNYESTVISLTTLKENIDIAFNLFTEALQFPAFAELDLDRLKDRKIDHLKTINSNPHYIANANFNYILYGAHPFGRSYMSSGSFVSRITKSKIEKYYQRYFNAANAHLILSGDISPKEAKYLVQTYFANMRSGDKNVHDYATPPAKNLIKIRLIETDNPEKASIRIGSIGMAYNDPLYYKAIVMNKILGGYTNSRLRRIFKEEKNWSENVGTHLRFRNKPGPFYFYGEFKAEKADSAIQIVLDEMKKMVKTQPTMEELNKAKAFIIGSFYLETETAEQIAWKIQEIIVHNLPKNYLLDFSKHIENVTPADVQEAAKEIIDLNKLSISICVTTSNALVGSSQISNSGCINNALAIQILCRCPPENSCGYRCTQSSGNPT